MSKSKKVLSFDKALLAEKEERLKVTVQIAMELDAIHEELDFVPDCKLCAIADKYSVDIEECRKIRDRVQSFSVLRGCVQ